MQTPTDTDFLAYPCPSKHVGSPQAWDSCLESGACNGCWSSVAERFIAQTHISTYLLNTSTYASLGRSGSIRLFLPFHGPLHSTTQNLMKLEVRKRHADVHVACGGPEAWQVWGAGTAVPGSAASTVWAFDLGLPTVVVEALDLLRLRANT